MALKTNPEPKMTINKLGEYLVAGPKRQRKILEQLKYPKDNAFGFTPYGDVREAIKKYFINNFEESYINDLISALEEKLNVKETDPRLTDWQISVIGSSIEALENVLDSANINTDYLYEQYDGGNPKLLIHGVEISINPDLIVRSKVKNKDCAGALKIHISKNSSIDQEGSAYIATLLNNFTIDHLCNHNTTARNENSISYDVFSDSFVESPKAFKRRMEDIEAGCKNIKAIWDSI